ncbi:response regulator transcription factor [Acidisarcina polymorpha]|nr:response regulator [Acidisarcina polymorpha]
MVLLDAGTQERFANLFPAYPSRNLPAGKGLGARTEAVAENALIAIVDDDRWMRGSLERLLRSAGLTTQTFASAEDYLNASNYDEFTCIILDISLPGMSGFDLDRLLAAEERRLPIVFVSANDEPEVRQEAVQAGAVAFFGKPYEDNSLLNAVHTALKLAEIKNQ